MVTTPKKPRLSVFQGANPGFKEKFVAEIPRKTVQQLKSPDGALFGTKFNKYYEEQFPSAGVNEHAVPPSKGSLRKK